jgi:hypothetical protein
VLFRPTAHFDRRRVEVRRRGAERRRAHIEPKGEHQRIIPTPVLTPNDFNLKFVLL